MTMFTYESMSLSPYDAHRTARRDKAEDPSPRAIRFPLENSLMASAVGGNQQAARLQAWAYALVKAWKRVVIQADTQLF